MTDRLQTVVQRYKDHLNPGLAKLIDFMGFGVIEDRAEGCYIYDHEGEAYLDFLGGFAVIEISAYVCYDGFVIGACVGDIRTVRLPNDGGALVFVVFVGDFADDLLDDVLHRYDAVGAAIFVDHKREMNAARLHAREQIHRTHGRRHEQNLTRDLGRGQRCGEIDRLEIEVCWQRLLALGVLLRVDRGARRHERDEVADVHHADGVIERIVVDDETRMAGTLEDAHKFTDRNVLLHIDDVGTRHHHVANPNFAQTQDVLEHAALFRREARLARRHFLEHVLEVRADRAVAPSEQRTKRAPDPALPVAGGLHRHGQVPRLVRWRIGTGRVAVRHGFSGVPRIARPVGVGDLQTGENLAL
jgi:hypothetical protein